MANKVTWNEASPGNTDDVQEGALRIRETKQGTSERINRDHFFGGGADPVAETGGADSADTGYHRRVTIDEASSDRVTTATNRINTINQGTTAKMSEIWMQSQSMGGGTDQVIKYVGSNTTAKEVVTTAQTQTLTNKTLTAPSITNPTISGGSGNLDGVAIGANTPSSGKFTTLESTGNTTIGDADGDVIGLNGSTSGENRSSQSTKYPGAGKMNAGITGEIKMFAGANAPTGWLICDGSILTRSDYAELFTVIGHTYTDTSSSSTNGNQVASTSTQFRLPDLRGRVPVGAGQGLASTNTTAGSEKLSTSSNLSSRTLGYAGAGESHTLTAAQSGVKSHEHNVYATQSAHSHNIRTSAQWASNSAGTGTPSKTTKLVFHTFPNPPNVGAPEYQTGTHDSVGYYEGGIPFEPMESATPGITVKPNSDGSGTANETASSSSDASDGHTNMQPWLAVNYIIKY